ncbi:MAG: nucleotidyl transferase [Candidatus Cloacimonadota bacterium]|nr:MAG: nucleotidyl transferase [Candidatus Cloacimonadota bacterium]
MKALKVILPVAGSGTRLRPHTLTNPKVLLRVAGKPILGYIMKELLNHPISEVIFIVGHLGKQIESYIKENFQLKTRFVYQKEQLGLGHAVYLTKDFVKPDEEILILLGDTIFEINLNDVIKSEKSLIGVKEVENPSRFGVVKLVDGKVEGFVEKPKKFISNLAIVGIYYLKESGALLEALEENIQKGKKTKGEFQLTDGLQQLIEKGYEIGIFPVEGWFDCGKPETLLATNRHLLKRYHRGVRINGSVIIPPVFIGKDTVIKRSVIGPYVSVANGCEIIDSIIKNSILNTNALVKMSILSNSIMGESAIVNGGFQSLNVGDFSQIVQNLIEKRDE